MINFISGLIIGGFIVMILMCLLQINRINEMQNRIDLAIEIIKSKESVPKNRILKILGGDVDDE